MSSCEGIQKETAVLGCYKLQENCGRIQRAGRMYKGCDKDIQAGKEPCLGFLSGEIGDLKVNLAFIRKALNLFYGAA
jgi:hypothetical protein